MNRKNLADRMVYPPVLGVPDKHFDKLTLLRV